MRPATSSTRATWPLAPLHLTLHSRCGRQQGIAGPDASPCVHRRIAWHPPRSRCRQQDGPCWLGPRGLRQYRRGDAATLQELGINSFQAIPVSVLNGDNGHWQSVDINRQARARQNRQDPVCLWFTGLSGPGKSTIANLLETALRLRKAHLPSRRR
jgi:hypothetical protein